MFHICTQACVCLPTMKHDVLSWEPHSSGPCTVQWKWPRHQCQEQPELPRTDMQHSVTQPGPTSVWACISAKRSWGCSGSPACSLIPVPSLLLELWYPAPAQSAWSSTEPSAPKLTLEGTNPKAWGRYKITLPERSPQGLGSAWKPLVSSSSRGRPLSYIAADDPNFWGTVIPKKSSPAVLLVDFLKEVQSTELCQDYTQEWCWSPAWESTSIYHPQVDSDKTLEAPSQMSMSSENF